MHGPKKNPLAFGSSVQIEYSDGSKGPKREIRSGAGYLSQDSPVQILGVKQNAKFIITGDPGQVDLPKNTISGIKEAILILNNTSGVGIVHLNKSDVIRNKLVKKIVDAYKKIENSN